MNDQELIQLRRARQLAVAILGRSRDAGIPSKYQRLKPKEFATVLDPAFHGGPVEGVPPFADRIYNEPDFLLKRDFIAIDGGGATNEARQLAGFALLFRMIAYDKIGQSFDCDALRHKFQTIRSTEGVTRNDLAEELKEYDVLFLSEFNSKSFDPHFEHGSFFDEVLTDRINNERPTIVSFVNPIMSGSREEVAMAGNCDGGCGRHLNWLGRTPQTNKSVLRVRVKNI